MASGGMRTPGLIAAGFSIQRVRLPRVFASVPAAIVERLLKCVRSGPTVAACIVAADEWQSGAAAAHEHALAVERASSRLAARAARDAAASHAANFDLRLGDDIEGHLRVLQPAELGALTAIDAGGVGAEPVGVVT